LVRLENVGLRYGHGPEILRSVSFHLEPGGFRFLTGPSGAGKTSLLRLLFAALKPTRGSVQLFGEDVALLDRPAIPYRLLDHLSTYDNVALPLRVAGLRESSYRTDVLDLLSWVGLSEQVNAYPAVLSGGEKQRAAIARAVIAKPELLLADEPTGNVDPALAKRLLHLFVELNRLGTTVLIATHDLKLVSQVKAKTLHLEAGELSET
jgi:cell division transport system ATP-binding protein